MTKEVTVLIDGLQLDAEAESVITITPGIYHHSHGKHFIQYEENAESGEGSTQSILKIAPNRVEIVKKGITMSHMIFEGNMPSQTPYETPYGSLFLEILTTGLSVVETSEEILVSLQYTLSANGDFLSDNRIIIKISSRY